MPTFSHLHVHTQYSLLDGAASVEKLYDKAIENKMPALAITDHGNMFGAFEFVSQAWKKTKIVGKDEFGKDILEPIVKPVVGCEFYVVEDMHIKTFTKELKDKRYHQVLLAKNKKGYENLVKLTSLGFIEGMYSKYPRIDKKLIEQYHEGIIATTCCIGAYVPQSILNEGPEKAEKEFKWWLDLFGEDYFIEIQRHNIKEQEIINNTLLQFSKKYNVPVIATNDSHYVDQDDANAHDILLCINTGEKQSTPGFDDFVNDDAQIKNRRFKFPNDQFYFKTQEEMGKLFSDIPESLDNTNIIVDRVEVLNLKKDILLPAFPIPKEFQIHKDANLNQWEFLQHITREGAKMRYNDVTPEIQERLDFELFTIKTMGFAGYFLIVSDFIKAGREMDVFVGPGRGSAAGSLVAYSLGITGLDPLEHGLLFERFLNPERISMPDIDLDFDERRRSEMIRYATNKYGEDRVAQIITYGTIKSKQAIKDSTRVLGYPYVVGEKLTKALPPSVMGKDISLSGVFDPKDDRYGEAGEFRSLYNADPDSKRVVDTARGLEGLKRQWGVHAAGVILSREPLLDVIPIHRREADGAIITQFDMGACEATGLLKMDFLGLRNLSVLDDCLLNIKANQGKDVVLEDLTLDDPKTYALLSRGDTLGVFQLDGGPMRALLKSMSPDSFEDISAVIALYRPGPMGENAHNNYADRKNGRKPVEPIHPELSDPLHEILGDTYGLIVYQEQVMAIAQKVAGFTLGRADLLRKAMGKKNKEILDKEYVPFEAGMKENGFSTAAIKRLWEVLIPFSDYAFNRAHSAGYGVVSYWTAYLKANYPTEYMAALLTSVRDDKDKSALYLSECRRMGIKVLPPDVNESDAEYTPRGVDIRFGLAAIRNVGEGVVASIKNARDSKGRYTSFGDFLAKVDAQVCNKKTIESLIKAGAFGSLGSTRKGLIAIHLEAIDSVIESKRAEAIGQFDLFGGEAVTAVSGLDIEVPTGEWDKAMLLSYEREMLGLYVSDHPLLGVEHVLRANTDMSISELADHGAQHEAIVTIGGLITSVTRKVSRQGASWAVVTVEDLEGSLEVLFFANTYNQYSMSLTEDRIVTIRGRVDRREDALRFTALEMSMPDISAGPTGPLVISLPIQQCTPPVVDRIKEILRSHPGKREVHLQLVDNGSSTVMKVDALITSSPSLSADLKSILGPNCLV